MLCSTLSISKEGTVHFENVVPFSTRNKELERPDEDKISYFGNDRDASESEERAINELWSLGLNYRTISKVLRLDLRTVWKTLNKEAFEKIVEEFGADVPDGNTGARISIEKRGCVKRNNSRGKTKWQVVFFRKGRIFTRTYHDEQTARDKLAQYRVKLVEIGLDQFFDAMESGLKL